jgi:hypothetical protein
VACLDNGSGEAVAWLVRRLQGGNSGSAKFLLFELSKVI